MDIGTADDDIHVGFIDYIIREFLYIKERQYFYERSQHYVAELSKCIGYYEFLTTTESIEYCTIAKDTGFSSQDPMPPRYTT